MGYGFYYIHSLLEWTMGKASWHLRQLVILSISFSSVRSVENIFMKCARGNQQNHFYFLICYVLNFLHKIIPLCNVSTPFNATRDFALWLWTAHNKVNKRLMKTESSLGTIDPKFPKTIWPPKQLCPACYANKNQTENSHINWDHDEVFKFLIGHYGNMLVSRYKDKDTEIMSHKSNTDSEELVMSRNAFVVPVGATVAIALASCLFGAVAYVWRSQQKRKYFFKPIFIKMFN